MKFNANLTIIIDTLLGIIPEVTVFLGVFAIICAGLALSANVFGGPSLFEYRTGMARDAASSCSCHPLTDVPCSQLCMRS